MKCGTRFLIFVLKVFASKDKLFSTTILHLGSVPVVRSVILSCLADGPQNTYFQLLTVCTFLQSLWKAVAQSGQDAEP